MMIQIEREIASLETYTPSERVTRTQTITCSDYEAQGTESGFLVVTTWEEVPHTFGDRSVGVKRVNHVRFGRVLSVQEL